MKKLRLLSQLLLILVGNAALAQVNIDKLMVERAPNCEDIAYNCSLLIKRYFDTNKYDSSKIILNYWENKCGKSEPIVRLKILFAIMDGHFSEEIYDSTIIEYLKIYQNRFQSVKSIETYNYYKYYYGFIPLNGEFDRFTSTLAQTLLIDQKPNTLEYLFCKSYAENPTFIFYEIQKSYELRDSKLSIYYYNLINRYDKLPEFGWSIYSGAWVPTGNANLLGTHPLIGFEAGYKSQRMIYYLSMYFKFLKAANNYDIDYENAIQSTNYFFGGYIGFDVEREFFKVRKNEFHLLAGIGWDGFDAVETSSSYNNYNNTNGKTIGSLNINTGLGFMRYFTSNKYIELRVKYNFVSYSNKGGTNLSGNSITMAVVLGGFSNLYKNSSLKSLNYLYE